MTGTRIPVETLTAAYAQYREGASIPEIGKEIGRGRSTLIRAFRRQGWEVLPRYEEMIQPIRDGDHWLIPLVGAHAKGRCAMVDTEDLEKVRGLRWSVSERTYPSGRVCGPYAQTRRLLMHTLLTGNPLTDHENHNGLDNRRANLRAATPAENAHNRRAQRYTSSAYKGVTWHRGVRKWQASIKTGTTNRYLGCYAAEEDAAKAYDAVARELHGEFAYLNFPPAGVA